MTKTKPDALGWFVHGPLGRFGRKLGFRWVFPVGTMPVPYHPLITALALAAPFLWVGYVAVSALTGAAPESSTWMVYLAIAALLGLLMSVPVLVWFLMVFRAPLIQASLIGLAMALLTVDVVSGRASPWLAVLPAGFVLLFTVQVLGGTAWWRRIERERAQFAPLACGQRVVSLTSSRHAPVDLIAACDIARLYVPRDRSRGAGRMYHWLRPADAAALEQAWGLHKPSDWTFIDRGHAIVLSRPGTAPGSGALRVGNWPLHTPFWLVTGLRQIAVRGAGRPWRLVWGSAQTVVPIPLFTAYRYTSISGRQHNRWVLGFPRRTAGELPSSTAANAPSLAPLFVPRGADAGTFDSVGLEELHAILAAEATQRAARREQAIANIGRFWMALSAGAGLSALDRLTVDVLVAEPDRLDVLQVAPVLDWLERARADRDMSQLLASARLLEAFADEYLAPHRARLDQLFDSLSLALQWDVSQVVDRAPLPRNLPAFAGNYGGFGLFLWCPSLYAKLARISPRLAASERVLRQRIASDEPGLCTTARLIVEVRHGSASRASTGT